MKDIWEERLFAYCYALASIRADPADHFTLASRFAKSAIGRDIDQNTYNKLKKVLDLLNLPPWKISNGNPNERFNVQPTLNNIHTDFVHPLSGIHSKIENRINLDSDIEKSIVSIVSRFKTSQSRFLAIWRLLPETFAKTYPDSAHLPSDWRLPDHTIWQQAQINSGVCSAFTSASGPALFSFSFGPVQSFIEAARSVRDLWSGSTILSWLSFQAMIPVIENYGPSSVIFPSLRGVPLVDLWLESHDILKNSHFKLNAQICQISCLPNRFIAIVPFDESESLTQKCKESFQDGWDSLTKYVHDHINHKCKKGWPNWDQYWGNQTTDFFDAHYAVLPYHDCNETIGALLFSNNDNHLSSSRFHTICENWPSSGDHKSYYYFNKSWPVLIEMISRLIETKRNLRNIPQGINASDDGMIPQKCSLIGTQEQMGPGNFLESRKFWDAMYSETQDDRVRIREGERFGAIALTKRFASPFLEREMGLSNSSPRFPDTATIAAQEWLEKSDMDWKKLPRWSGQWLHQGNQILDDIPTDVKEKIRIAKSDQSLPPPIMLF